MKTRGAKYPEGILRQGRPLPAPADAAQQARDPEAVVPMQVSHKQSLHLCSLDLRLLNLDRY
jgi:hypothetical protein